jgi:hypothetical protein
VVHLLVSINNIVVVQVDRDNRSKQVYHFSRIRNYPVDVLFPFKELYEANQSKTAFQIDT